MSEMLCCTSLRYSCTKCSSIPCKFVQELASKFDTRNLYKLLVQVCGACIKGVTHDNQKGYSRRLSDYFDDLSWSKCRNVCLSSN